MTVHAWPRLIAESPAGTRHIWLSQTDPSWGREDRAGLRDELDLAVAEVLPRIGRLTVHRRVLYDLPSDTGANARAHAVASHRYVAWRERMALNGILLPRAHGSSQVISQVILGRAGAPEGNPPEDLLLIDPAEDPWADAADHASEVWFRAPVEDTDPRAQGAHHGLGFEWWGSA